jgi:hypothetical protein
MVGTVRMFRQSYYKQIKLVASLVMIDIYILHKQCVANMVQKSSRQTSQIIKKKRKKKKV